MGKECFTCTNKQSTDLTQEERQKIKEENNAKGKPFQRIPEMIFHCKITGKQINLIDPACKDYSDDDVMVNIKKELSKTAKKLRKELNM